MGVNGLKFKQQISHRVACGEFDNKAKHPVSRNYFCINLASRGMDDRGSYGRDTPLERSLVDEGYGFMVGDLACVQRIPIVFDTNCLTNMCVTYFAYHKASGCMCKNHSFNEGRTDNVAQRRVFKKKEMGKGLVDTVMTDEWEDCPCPCDKLDVDGNGGEAKPCKATLDLYFQIYDKGLGGTYCLFRTHSRLSMQNIASGFKQVIERYGAIAGLKFILQIQMIKSKAHRFPTVILGLAEGNNDEAIAQKLLTYRPLESLGDGTMAREISEQRFGLISSQSSIDFETQSYRRLAGQDVKKLTTTLPVEGEGRL